MAVDDKRLQGALDDLQGYLADNLAPLLVADAFETLLDYPAAVTAEQLRVWSYFQFQGRGGATPISDILFHALKKVQQIEVHDLVPGDRFDGFLRGVALALVEICPEGERDRLASLLKHLRESVSTTSGLIDRLHRPGGASAAPATPNVAIPPGMVVVPAAALLTHMASAAVPAAAAAPPATAAPGPPQGAVPTALSSDEMRDLRRFTLAVEAALGRTGGAAPDEGVARQMLVMATAGARNETELEARLVKLREAGVAAPAVQRDVFRSLVDAIPDWTVAVPGGPGATTGSTEALRRATKLGGDHWTDLLKASADQFNAGALGRSVALIDLADRMVRDGEVDLRRAEIARGQYHESFEVMKLLQAAADRRNWPLLHRLIEFFTAWSVRDLLDALVYQPESKKRRLLIAMLEVWGAEARPLVLERLEVAIAEGSRDPNFWWYLRNLVFLLQRLPRGADQDPKREVELVSAFSALSQPVVFQREAIQLLGSLPQQAGAPILIQRLGESERALDSPTPILPYEEIWKIQSALATALVRTGSHPARRALIEHALARRPRDGDSLSRLRDLGRVDLKDDGDSVRRLLAALHELAPRKVFGFVVARRDAEIETVARALVATSSPSVRQALAELTARMPDLDLDRPVTIVATEEQLAATPESTVADDAPAERFGIAPEPEPMASRGSLSGDLELFGLAGLLQTFQQSDTSGRLALRDGRGQLFAEIGLDRGKLVDAHSGRLAGPAAIYQLLETPRGGTFEFLRAEPQATAPAGARDILGLLLEGMRRYDELQRLRVVVPDDFILRPGGAKPTVPEEETDGDFIRQVWDKVRSGTARVVDCESTLSSDSYRVRALLAHWLEGGALRV